MDRHGDLNSGIYGWKAHCGRQNSEVVPKISAPCGLHNSLPLSVHRTCEWNRLEWNGWNGWNGMDGMDGMEWNGMDGMEWNGMTSMMRL